MISWSRCRRQRGDAPTAPAVAATAATGRSPARPRCAAPAPAWTPTTPAAPRRSVSTSTVAASWSRVPSTISTSTSRHCDGAAPTAPSSSGVARTWSSATSISRAAVVVEQVPDDALVLQPGHRHQRAPARRAAHQVGQLGRHVAGLAGGQRQAHLGPRPGGGRQLEVPAGVLAAGAPAQRHLGAQQVQPVGVVVGGVELVRLRLGDAGDARVAGRPRMPPRSGSGVVRVDLQLRLDLGGAACRSRLAARAGGLAAAGRSWASSRGRPWDVGTRFADISPSADWRRGGEQCPVGWPC